MAATELIHLPAGSHQIDVYSQAATNPAVVYLASLAPGSQPAMRHALAVVATILHGEDPAATTQARRHELLLACPWGDLRYAHTQALRTALMAAYDARTANKMLSALRGTLRAAWRLGLLSADQYMAAVDVASVKGERPDQAAGRALAMGEILALVTACHDGTAAGTRDAAILGVAYAGGLRRAEIAALQLDAYAGGVLTVHGKRNKVRTVPMADGAAAAIADWVQLRGTAAGALFLRVDKAGRILDAGLTPAGVRAILARRAAAAGVATFTPHDMRRSFAGDLLDAGVDLATVQKLMGHASPTTTSGYDRRGERAKAEAVKRLHFPYQSTAKSK